MKHTRPPLLTAILTTCIASIASADGTSPTIIIYTPDGSTTPQFRTWGAPAWGNAAALPAVEGYAHWVVARNSPARNETAAAFYGHTRALSLAFYDGSAWSTPMLLASDVGVAHTQRAFDLVYENSGDMLVAWWDSASGKIISRSGSAASLGSEKALDLGDATGVRWVRMVPQPATNRVLLLALNDHDDLFASFWAGSSWKAPTTLSTQQYNDDTECFAAAFESQSRDGLIIYTQSSSPVIRYRTTSGSTISAEQNGPNSGDNKIRWIRAVANPTNNQILVVIAAEGLALNAVVWDGTAFGSVTEVAAGLEYDNRQQFDIAWQPDGARALLVHTQSDTGIIAYRQFVNGAWGHAVNGPNGGSTNALLTLTPAASGTMIFGAYYGTDNDLFTSWWTGAQMSNAADLNGNIEGALTCQSFMVVAPSSPQVEAEADEDAATVKRVVQWQEADPR